MNDIPSRYAHLSPLKQALLVVEEMRAELDAYKRARSEPIAIVGISCRFPGGANDPESYWHLLRAGKDAITDIPAERWDAQAYYDPDPEAAGKMYSRFGGFIEDVDLFDPTFFGISPREAARMDPQQRLLLEVSWEALERAGTSWDKLAGSRAGVFVGITANDYATLLRDGDAGKEDAYFLTGNPLNAAAGRLSFTFGFQGPCMAVDTACSSSLVAVHLACQSLRAGESELALAGGVNLVLTPRGGVVLSRARMLAADGRCKAFDAAADGFVRGEGCGMVVLKRLTDAQRDRNPILALVRGTAVNHDGRSSGFTVPNGLAQQMLIREAVTAAGVDPAAIDYVEAHGTGTSLGDPVEIRALMAVLGAGRSAARPVRVGTAKSNIGHLEAASGVAGLIKTVLAIHHEEIPPHLHFRRPNPEIAWKDMPIVIPTQPTPWPRTSHGPRWAGVSSFGASGTNVHVVLQESPWRETTRGAETGPCTLTLSAKTPAALRQLVARYTAHLEAQGEGTVLDLCMTANTARARLAFRLAAAASSPREMRQALQDWLDGKAPAQVCQAHVPAGRPRIGFLFAGPIDGHAEADAQLIDAHPVVQSTMAEGRAHLAELGMAPGANGYDECFSFLRSSARAALWQSWGVLPSLTLGIGPAAFAAAQASGVFDIRGGIQLLAAAVTGVDGRARDVRLAMPRTAMISDRTGTVVSANEATDKAYWRRAFPHPTAGPRAAEELLRQHRTDVVLWVDCGEPRDAITLAKLYTQGVDLDWQAVAGNRPWCHVAAPTYPFQRQRYWCASSKPETSVSPAAGDLKSKLEQIEQMPDEQVDALLAMLQRRDR